MNNTYRIQHKMFLVAQMKRAFPALPKFKALCNFDGNVSGPTQLGVTAINCF